MTNEGQVIYKDIRKTQFEREVKISIKENKIDEKYFIRIERA